MTLMIATATRTHSNILVADPRENTRKTTCRPLLAWCWTDRKSDDDHSWKIPHLQLCLHALPRSTALHYYSLTSVYFPRIPLNFSTKNRRATGLHFTFCGWIGQYFWWTQKSKEKERPQRHNRHEKTNGHVLQRRAHKTDWFEKRSPPQFRITNDTEPSFSGLKQTLPATESVQNKPRCGLRNASIWVANASGFGFPGKYGTEI